MAEQTRLQKKYIGEVIPALVKEFNYENPSMQVPRLEKIVLNRGVGEATNDKKLIDAAVEEFGMITGQKPVVINAKKSVSNFKLREGVPIGVKVTLRGNQMYEFLDRLINVALPRVRDFRGLPVKGFDGRGNFSLGIQEQIIFPEIDVDKIKEISGLEITFVTTAPNDEEALALLRAFGMPFQGQNKEIA